MSASVLAPTPMQNAKFSGKEGKLKRKTEMCRAYQGGICGWGAECNYAHSEAELCNAISKLPDARANNKATQKVPPTVVSTRISIGNILTSFSTCRSIHSSRDRNGCPIKFSWTLPLRSPKHF